MKVYLDLDAAENDCVYGEPICAPVFFDQKANMYVIPETTAEFWSIAKSSDIIPTTTIRREGNEEDNDNGGATDSSVLRSRLQR